MSQSESERRPPRFDVRAATAAALILGVLGGGGAEPQQAGKPSADGPAREVEIVDPTPRAGKPSPTEPTPTPEAEPRPEPAATPAVEPEPPAAARDEAPAAAKPIDKPVDRPVAAGLLRPDEAEALLADATERIQALTPPADGSAKPGADPAAKLADKALAEVLEDRRRRLDEYAKLAKELAELTAPENAPERRLADAKAELADLQARLAQPVDSLLPAAFAHSGAVDQAGRDQMKEAIEGLKKDVKDDQDKLESGAADPEKEAKIPLAALRADRDRISQALAALKAREAARADAPPAKSAAERKLFDERGVNLRVETAVETVRSQVVERRLAQTAKLAEVAGVDRRRWIARVQLGRKVLEPMQARFRQLAEADERDLQRKASAEQAKADRSIDPIERYRAERLSELLDLEAAAIKAEQAATASVPPTLEEMRSQANIAEANFARIKGLIEEGRLNRIDVLSINADYRRLDPERRRVRRDERDVVEKRLRDYANMLTTVELSQIEDRLLDQIDLDDLLDKLPPGRRPQAVALWKELEERHSTILTRHREALAALVRSETEILDQVDRRLAILDDESSFIRTHMFWVRDQDPISLTTVGMAAGELRRLTRVSLGLTRQALQPSGWKPSSPEFLAASAVIVVLPLGVIRVRRTLKHRLAQALPPPPSTAAPAPAPEAGGPDGDPDAVVRQG
ncbi:hypothetical protein [Planctomyces sp. SH-PL62]|uniref:hypothetical protein n=1 Tax=Planctomyces sp. SH-PL62 TaxID=1636152 RepID=UPI00078DAF69|nr:hypothetical protein [Planctomyces sp. SH-PL62]AMV40621.1 hypothetical protein VT85_24535 [Planctomyces sp. SH-PL62]